MRRLGAEVRLEGADFDAAKSAARAYAEAHGCPFVEDGALRTIAEGAGTIARSKSPGSSPGQSVELDAILVPLGNGALLTGIGTWIRAEAPRCKVIARRRLQCPGHETILGHRPARLDANRRNRRRMASPCANVFPTRWDCMKNTVDEVLAGKRSGDPRGTRFLRPALRSRGRGSRRRRHCGCSRSRREPQGQKRSPPSFCGGNVRMDIA